MSGLNNKWTLEYFLSLKYFFISSQFQNKMLSSRLFTVFSYYLMLLFIIFYLQN